MGSLLRGDERRGKSPSLIAEYLALAGLGRFTIELFRTNPAFLGPLTNAQVVAIASVVLGASVWIARGRLQLDRQPSQT
jgi:prolipoprotein diacylglyceryltransferase